MNNNSSRALSIGLSLLAMIACACNRGTPTAGKPKPPVGPPSPAPVTFHVSEENDGTITDPKQSVHPLEEVDWQALDKGVKFKITFPDHGGNPCNDGNPSLKQAQPYTLSCMIDAGAHSTYEPHIAITTMRPDAPPHLCGGCTMTVSPTP